MTSTFSEASAAFQQIVKDSGKKENEYLFMLLEIVSSRTPGNEIWQTVE